MTAPLHERLEQAGPGEGEMSEAEQWEYVAQIIMRWPRLGVCSSTDSQIIVGAINEHLAATYAAAIARTGEG